MGSYLTVETRKIFPSQDFLKENTVRFIFSCIEQGNLTDLPPAPIVRAVSDGENFVAIDGHNLIAVKDYLGQDIEVYVAENNEDYLENEQIEGVVARNKDLHDKFDTSVAEAESLVARNVISFKDLQHKYPALFPGGVEQ